MSINLDYDIGEDMAYVDDMRYVPERTCHRAIKPNCMVCSECHYVLNDEWLYCPHCGSRIEVGE